MARSLAGAVYLLTWCVPIPCLLVGAGIATPRAAAQEIRSTERRRPDGRGNRPRTMAPQNAASGVVDTGNQIEYFGGPVLLGTVNIYYIWYGTWDSSSIGILTNLGSTLGGSPYFNINTGYFDSMGRSISNSAGLMASTNDNYSRGKSLGDNDIWLIVTQAIGSGKLPRDANGVYFVLTAGDVAVSGFPNSLCGWHSSQTFSGTDIHYSFVGNPDPTGLHSCAEQTISPNGNAGADAMASTLAHELDESVTDPDLNAWYDAGGEEVADKCAWTFGATYSAPNGSLANMRLGAKDYLIQQNWVNAAGGYCGLSYSPGPDFALLATSDTQTAIAGNATPNYAVTIIPVKGFAGPISFSVTGLPGGATASVVASSPTSATFTISTASNLGSGTYPFTLMGTSGGLSHPASLTLKVSGRTLLPAAVTVGAINPEPSIAGQSYSVNYSVTANTGTPTGNVTVSDGSASCTATVAAGVCTLASTTAGTQSISVAYAGDNQYGPLTVTKLHSVLNGGFLADLVSGGGWETTFTLVNLGSSSSSASLNFYGDTGASLALPYTFPQNSGSPAETSAVSQNIGSNAVLLLDSSGGAGDALSQGWATLAAAGNVNAFEVFRYGPSGQEAVVPMQTGTASSYLLAFDNTSLVNVLGTGVAIANVSAQDATITVLIRNDAGAQISSKQLPLSAHQHVAFTLATQYPETAGKRGTVQFLSGQNGQISVLGIRSNGTSFTTIPAIAGGTAAGGSMAEIASGGGWRSIFTVVNTGGSSANFTLSFFDDNGSPLSLPLTFLQTGNMATAASVTQSLAAGASLVVQAQSPDTQSTLGSAQLTSNGSVSGFALFRYDPTGQEATAPLENRDASAYVLAFDNTGVLKTGVALANQLNKTVTVGLIIRDDSGNILQTTSRQLTANAHAPFVLDTDYPLTAGKRGTVEFDLTGGGISVLGIRANGNAFTSIPVLTR